jgi:hypothetical protein
MTKELEKNLLNNKLRTLTEKQNLAYMEGNIDLYLSCQQEIDTVNTRLQELNL